MNQIITTTSIPLPEPRTPISIRRATMDDIPFMDALQKKHSKELGFFSRAMFEGYITKYTVLVASCQLPVASPENAHSLATDNQQLATPPGTPIGYVCSTDRYLKRDELGAIFQMCVDSNYRRSFIAAALLKEVFEQSAYGCKLYCCWCA